MKTPYGYIKDGNRTYLHPRQPEIVRLIMHLYLQGQSLGGIVEQLQERQIPSPSSKAVWSRATINAMLSNKAYVPAIVSFEQYLAVQIEKDRRSNLDDDNRRKSTRYHSKNVLAGLLVCGDCGKSYRRITRPNGDIVWWCADKVEHGKAAVCQGGRSISETEVYRHICRELGMVMFEEDVVREKVEKIIVGSEMLEIFLNEPAMVMVYTG